MKTAIITGATSGIGSAIVNDFKKAGWEAVELNHQVIDLSDLKAVERKAEDLKEHITQIDVFIHVAGVWHDSNQALADKKFEQFTSQQIVETMNVGLTACMILINKLMPNILKTGAVIGISGTFSEGGAGWVPYYASKRGLEDFLIALSQDYTNGPKIYGISPADVATPAYKKYYPEYAASAQSPEVVAKLCLDLVNDETDYKNGDIITIRDGKTSKGYHG